MASVFSSLFAKASVISEETLIEYNVTIIDKISVNDIGKI